jgi:hypothetical protein
MALSGSKRWLVCRVTTWSASGDRSAVSAAAGTRGASASRWAVEKAFTPAAPHSSASTEPDSTEASW